MYDIFYIGEKNSQWKKFKDKFLSARQVNSLAEASKKSITKMFWAVWSDLEIVDDFNFTYECPEWDLKYVHVFKNSDRYDGVLLVPKRHVFTEEEIKSRHFLNKKEIDILASIPKPYDVYEIDTYDEYLSALENSTTELFWLSSANITATIPDVYFTHDNEYDRKQNHAFIHRVDDKDLYNGLFLCSKHKLLTEREINYRHPVNRKEWNIVGSGPKPYDVFEIDTYDEYLSALESSSTELFWMSSANITATIPDIYFTHDNEYDRKQNHAFIHRVDDKDLYNGLFLCSKHKPLTEREINYRHPVARKEWDVVGSTKKPYNVFEIDSYDEYLHALEHSTTEMFWMSSANITATIPDIYFTHDNEYDRKQNHAFIHQVDDRQLYNGLFLCSKHQPLTQKEVEHRHPVARKEWDVVGSTKKPYNVFEIDSYDEYLHALEHSTTEMFWMSSKYITADIPFVYFDHSNTHDRKQNHAFMHQLNNQQTYNGVFLLSKHSRLSKNEIELRHPIKRKEWSLTISRPKTYDVFEIDSYDEYCHALETSTTEMFWSISKQSLIIDKEIFNTSYEPKNIRDKEFKYERSINHTYLHKIGAKNYNSFVWLLSKQNKVSKKEFENKSLSNAKHHKKIVSINKPFDMVFISYQEPNANENYARILERFPKCKRVHGIKGIHEAHIEAASICDTKMFWIIDGDAQIVGNFNFDYEVYPEFMDHVHVWRSINPINDLVYGYGGVKLFPRLKTINMDISKPDMTTSISNKFMAIPEISNITAFNTDPFSTWRSAFRECCKLSSKIIDRQIDDETDNRLNTWCNIGKDKLYGEYAIAGAIAGAKYGAKNKNNIDALMKINNFDWLEKRFREI